MPTVSTTTTAPVPATAAPTAPLFMSRKECSDLTFEILELMVNFRYVPKRVLINLIALTHDFANTRPDLMVPDPSGQRRLDHNIEFRFTHCVKAGLIEKHQGQWVITRDGRSIVENATRWTKDEFHTLMELYETAGA